VRGLGVQVLFAHSVSVTAILALAGCGIDQGGAPAPTAGAPATSSSEIVVIGPITGFGSVIVNGLTLQTAAADIVVDGNPVSESVLREGQIIRAVAAVTSSSINAISIEYQENVRGPVETLDTAAGTITVLGQPVQTNTRTVFDIGGGSSLNDLALPARIEVSGFRLPSGTILATYLGVAGATDQLTATTAITSVDTNTLTFELGDLTVDYSQVLMLDVPTGIPDIGLVVEVEGTAVGVNGELIVTEVRALPTTPGDLAPNDLLRDETANPATDTPTDRRANIYSVVTATNLPSSITIGTVTVSIDALTQIINGNNNDIAPGRLVQVEGDAANSGVIEADRIELL
jgi:hypothetical protein